MYVKDSFRMPDEETARLLADVRAAELVSMTDDGLVASLLPFVWDPGIGEQGALLSHVMRVNTQWRDSRGEVLVLVRGLDHHVTSEWLPEGDRIPTWNYEAVHVHGELIVHDDVDFCRDVVSRTVAAYEPRWRVETSGEDIEPMLRAIVGVEVRVQRVEAKAKLSQNRHPDVIRSIARGLADTGRQPDADALLTRSLPVAQARQDLVEAARRRRAERP